MAQTTAISDFERASGWTSLLFSGLSRTTSESEARGREATKSSIDEEGLIARARQGDAESFRTLVECYGNAAFGLALRIVGSTEEAEEVAQDAFVRAWRALPRFRGDARFSTWLFRIVTRRAIDELAVLRRRRGREIHLGASDLEVLPDPKVSSETGRTRLRLERFIGELPDIQRAVVTLFYLQGQSVRDVAHILDLPPGTVKTHLHRSRAVLRKAWLHETAGEKDDELRGL